jgi:Family of unknown function (DUF6634)
MTHTVVSAQQVARKPIHERSQPPPPLNQAKVGPVIQTRNEFDMLTELFPFLLPCHIERGLPSRLRRLADDLEKLRSGGEPTSAELASAPLIEDWRVVLTPMGLRMDGFVSNHPLLGTRHTLISQLWAADADGRWVRTLSRFYRLGESSDPKLPDTLVNNEVSGYDGVPPDV